MRISDEDLANPIMTFLINILNCLLMGNMSFIYTRDRLGKMIGSLGERLRCHEKWECKPIVATC